MLAHDKQLVIGTITMVGNSLLHQEPDGLEIIKARRVAFDIADSVFDQKKSYSAYIKDDSSLGLLCPAGEALVSKKFWITLHVEEFRSGFMYIVIDELEPYCMLMDNESSVQDFLEG